jgi:hypothetical protein
MPQVGQSGSMSVPTQLPLPMTVQPGQAAALHWWVTPHSEHDWVGVPTHEGWALKTCGGTGA